MSDLAEIKSFVESPVSFSEIARRVFVVVFGCFFNFQNKFANLLLDEHAREITQNDKNKLRYINAINFIAQVCPEGYLPVLTISASDTRIDYVVGADDIKVALFNHVDNIGAIGEITYVSIPDIVAKQTSPDEELIIETHNDTVNIISSRTIYKLSASKNVSVTGLDGTNVTLFYDRYDIFNKIFSELGYNRHDISISLDKHLIPIPGIYDEVRKYRDVARFESNDLSVIFSKLFEDCENNLGCGMLIMQAIYDSNGTKQITYFFELGEIIKETLKSLNSNHCEIKYSFLPFDNSFLRDSK